MKNRNLLLLFLIMSFCMINFAACSSSNSGPKPNISSDNGNSKSSDTRNNGSLEKSGENMLASRPVEVLPWENEGEFKSALKDEGTPILMGAYCTILPDPLPGEEYNVHLAAGMLKGIVIKPGQVFSQNRIIGPYTEERGFKKGPTYAGTKLITTIGGGVCKIASTLYNVAVLSDLEIVERHAHNMPVPYVPYGQDATVSYGTFDFKFRNNTVKPIMVWAQGIDNALYIAFYGSTKPEGVQWQHETSNRKTAPVVYKNNPALPKGTEKKKNDGMYGAVVKSWVTIRYSDGHIKVRQMGKSYYEPMPHIIEVNR